MKKTNLPPHITLQLMAMHHHTKVGYKRLSGTGVTGSIKKSKKKQIKQSSETNVETNPSRLKSMDSPGFSSKREGVSVKMGLAGSGGRGLL